ncbi:ribosomal L7Ae/L30e/S12e/Gadd45 family protein [bacterium]|nr:ribosomal L7Ae/L30e/S12e/Gadd45 family protein [bacterium]
MNIEEIRGLLGLAHRARGLAIGSRETRMGTRRGEISLIILSADGSPRDRERIQRVAEEERVPVRTVGSGVELGAVIGRGAVGVLGIRDRNLASGILQRLPNESTGPAAKPADGPEKAGGE